MSCRLKKAWQVFTLLELSLYPKVSEESFSFYGRAVEQDGRKHEDLAEILYFVAHFDF